MLVEDIRERVQGGGLLDGGPVVVMLSGGRDSVCLLDVALALCGAGQVWALHVNYGLRADAEADEQRCRELCEQLGVPLEVIEVGGRDGDVGNMHAWARELRYRAAEDLAKQIEARSARRDEVLGEDAFALGGDGNDVSERGMPHARARVRVAAGHTSSDQVETILYRLAASPGRRALLGMAPREGRVVRPLLAVSREQTAAYCRERGLAWCEDASNDDPRYARARVRQALVPAFEAVHPGGLSNVLRTAELLREETELLDGLVDAELEMEQSIEIDRLRSLPRAMQRLVVVCLAERAAGVPVPQAGARVPEVIALASRQGRAELHVGGLVSAVVCAGRLEMVKIEPRKQRPQKAT